MQTHYQIDDYQDNYFVIDSFEKLFDDTLADFNPIYAELIGAPEHEAGVIAQGDKVLHKGTGTYAVEADKRREERKKK
jgi:phenylalanine-4-hydroxylase